MAAYQMYQELLDIVRSEDQPVDDGASASTNTTVPNFYDANMPVVMEESETEFPSFSMKKKGGAELKRNDSAFDSVIDSVL